MREHEIVSAARAWIGTPYVHQASVRNIGTDCLGLLRGVWREIFGTEPEAVPVYTRDWSEPQGDELLWQAAARHLQPKPLADAAVADVLLFRMREGSVAKHLGLQSSIGECGRFIHAYSGHGVIESGFTAPWQKRLAARFAFPRKDI